MSHFKKISFKYLKGIAVGKKLYGLNLVPKLKTVENFSDNLLEINLSTMDINNYHHSILSENKESFVKKVKIISREECVKCTNLSKLKQDGKYVFVSGDPYEFVGTVRGILHAINYLVIETEWGDLVLFSIDGDGYVSLIEIKSEIPENPPLKKISLSELEEMLNGKKLYEHTLRTLRTKDDLSKSLSDLEFTAYHLLEGNHYPLASLSNKEYFVDGVEIFYGNCVGNNPLSKLEQGKLYSFLAWDPIKFNGSVEGVFVDGRGNMISLILKTSSGDFLMFKIDEEEVLFLEIVE